MNQIGFYSELIVLSNCPLSIEFCLDWQVNQATLRLCLAMLYWLIWERRFLLWTVTRSFEWWNWLQLDRHLLWNSIHRNSSIRWKLRVLRISLRAPYIPIAAMRSKHRWISRISAAWTATQFLCLDSFWILWILLFGERVALVNARFARQSWSIIRCCGGGDERLSLSSIDLGIILAALAFLWWGRRFYVRISLRRILASKWSSLFLLIPICLLASLALKPGVR